jgi:hypothetical protein
MRIRVVGMAILTSLAAPVDSVLAQQGFSFRPDDVEAVPVKPGWQVTPSSPNPTKAEAASQPQEGYRFAPQAPSSAAESPAIGQRSDTASYPSYRYKPEEETAPMAQPAPLPKAVPPSNPLPPISGYGLQQGPQQSAVPGAPPWTGQVPSPGFPPGSAGSVQDARSPQPMQPPLRLENRYIDGSSQYANTYPFRPLENETRPQKPEKSAERPAAPPPNPTYHQAPYGVNAYAYPPMPTAPGYAPYPYNNYNSGPSFGGFRFPFSNGGFPFNFK